MDLEKPPTGDVRRTAYTEERGGEGCLTVAIRLPVRIVALVLVVPVRMAWDALVAAGGFLGRTVFRPLGRAVGWLARAVFVWPFVGLWRYVVVPLAKAAGWLGLLLVVRPVRWVYRWVLSPAGHALAWCWARLVVPVGDALWAAGTWLARYLLVRPLQWAYRWVLTPVGHALAWCGRGVAWCVRTVVAGIAWAVSWVVRVLLVWPALALWRWVLAPVGRVLAVVGREAGDALGHAWRIAGRISLAVGRFLGTLLRWIFVEPVRWVYRTVLTPVGHVVRDAVLRPAAAAARGTGRAVRQAFASARESVRQVRADVRRALFGAPPPARPVRRPVDRREPSGAEARTLGRSTTALTKD
ncbi:hypothetical protein [Streptomyces daghestanicus]|uniref:Integral membrane protein n=1 Tax=Streptomyces daghestanicus TaxID=66885 RepID=A0ABQ3QAH5_9ACTN|nr:hypothetical protein [Streptomyces daghestanicus]GGU33841.1 hypothetical protein GCM10010259_25410 [Streptomyces daghestanicus]GHI34249.1 hypothetical protein Sdagh_59790 [Streptomyces daghestanicus]